MNPTPSQSSELKFEIGHVLFIDIVGYSKLLINEQSEQIQKLKQIVRGTEQFRHRAGAHENWRQARSELEGFLKEQPENYYVIGALALTNMGLGDKAAAFKLIERAMAVIPIEKDAIGGAALTEILARVAAQMGERDRALAALQKLLSIPYSGPLPSNVPLTPALLRLDPMFDPLRSDPRFQKLIESKVAKP